MLCNCSMPSATKRVMWRGLLMPICATASLDDSCPRKAAAGVEGTAATQASKSCAALAARPAARVRADAGDDVVDRASEARARARAPCPPEEVVVAEVVVLDPAADRFC